jgi:hypothetical protein
MAILYESLLPELIPMVPGCPDSLIETNIRSAVIELCEKSGVYQAELDPVTTVAGLYEYDLEPPANTVVQKILWVVHKGKDLEPITTGLLEQRKPSWRDSDKRGEPEYFVKPSQALFWLVPVPNETIVSSTVLRVQLKPTHTSTACENEIMDDYRDTIVNGALFRLLRLPSKEWTDYAGAQVYGSLFQQGIKDAETKARHGDMPIARKVRYGGVHRSYGLSRKKYGREIA